MAATTLAIASIAGSVFSAASAAKNKPKAPPPMPAAPPAPKPLDPSAVIQRARATGPAAKSTTLLTGPSGLSRPAPTQAKTLLGL
jgi:hypothetical protein